MNFPTIALIRTFCLGGLFVPSLALATPDFDLFGGTAQAVEIPDGDITPQTIDGTDWGQVDWQGGPVSKTFKIKNNGDMDLLVVSANVNGSSDFSVSGLPGILSPIGAGLSATFTITFNPSAEAIRAAEIQIINTSGVSGENPFNFTVRGEGVTPPEIVVEGRESPSSSYLSIIDGSNVPLAINGTDFGTTSVTGSVIREFRIRNTGPGTLTISPSESSPDFSFFGLAATVAPGLADTFTITFSPTSTGTKTATFRIDNNDLDEDPFTFVIEGTAEDPDISISSMPPSYLQNVPDGQTVPSVTNDTDFGSQHIDNGGVTNAFRLRNSGNIDLDITSVSVTGADSGSFAITGLTSASPDVSPGGNIDFDITFDPSTAGTKNATVEIESNDPDESPYTFAIRG
ncbi:MAG: choice-of-anchor D domain-containing protein, partial [Verrucomicrobiota bacterium]